MSHKISDNILILGEVNSTKEAKKWVKDHRSEIKQLPKIFGGVSMVGGETSPGKYRVYIVAISKECRGCPAITRCIDSVVKGHTIKSLVVDLQKEAASRGRLSAEINARLLSQSDIYIMVVDRGYIQGLKDDGDPQHSDFHRQLEVAREERKKTLVVRDIQVTEEEIAYLKKQMKGINVVAWIEHDFNSLDEELDEKLEEALKRICASTE